MFDTFLESPMPMDSNEADPAEIVMYLREIVLYLREIVLYLREIVLMVDCT